MPVVGTWRHVITSSFGLLGLVLLVAGVRAEGDPEPESPPSPDHHYYQFYGYADDVTIDGEPLQTDDSITPILNGKAVTPALVGDNGFFLTFKHLFLEPPIGGCQVVYEIRSQQRAQTFTTAAFTHASGCGDIQVKLAIVTTSGNGSDNSQPEPVTEPAPEAQPDTGAGGTDFGGGTVGASQPDTGRSDDDDEADDQGSSTDTSESEATNESGAGESQASSGSGPTLPDEDAGSTAGDPEPDVEASEDELALAEDAEEDDLLEDDSDSAAADSQSADAADRVENQSEAQSSAAEIQRPAAPRTGTGGVYIRETTANWPVVASVLILLIVVIGLVTVMVKRRTDQSPR